MDGDTGDAFPGMPRWAKVFGLVLLALVLLAVVVLVVSRGEHGPGRHVPSSSGDRAADAVAADPRVGGVAFAAGVAAPDRQSNARPSG